MSELTTEFNIKKTIPKERLYFYFGDLRKKGDFLKTHVVSAMPFDIDEIRGLKDEKKWDRLKDMSVEFLKDNKELPSFAKEQDYERSGSVSYSSLNYLNSFYEKMVEQTKKDESEPIKVFNNAFDKIILPEGYRESIIEVVNQLKDYKVIFEDWGLGEKIKRGKGVNLLFSGESGTGKTYCGEVIAEYLGTTAEIISVATLESKWVGESEKNVSNLFKSINGNNRVLILDEVDSFLSSRSLSDQSPHYNKLTNQFLIELERHNGICVMTTNRPVKLDRALQRRIDLVLNFPFPTEEQRRKIWANIIPDKMPKENINYDVISEYPLNGGNIKNAILSAARKTITRSEIKLTMDILEEAVKEELSEKELLTNGKDHS